MSDTKRKLPRQEEIELRAYEIYFETRRRTWECA